MRDIVYKFCTTFLPETKVHSEYLHWNQIGFDHIAKDYGEGYGTTCGFLPHWLLWRLGCRDNTLVNRSDPEAALTFRIGENLSIFLPTPKRPRPGWISLDTEQKTRDAATKGKPGPKRGDFVIIRGGMWKDKDGNRTRDSSHIFVLLDVVEADGKKVVWRVAQTGLSNDAMRQAGQITTLTGELRESAVLDVNKEHDGPNLVFIADILGEEPNFPRRVIGYHNLDAIKFGSMPDAALTDMFERRRTELTTNASGKIQEWLGWWQLEPAGGFINMNPTYLLLQPGHEVTRLQKVDFGPYRRTAVGVWTRDGAKLDIEWTDKKAPRQSWSVATTFVPKKSTEGKPLVPTAGPLTKLKKPTPEIPLQWLMA